MVCLLQISLPLYYIWIMHSNNPYIISVYCDFFFLLLQTNIQFNNNKYYLIQLLKDDNKAAYSVWMRWGRVGATGQNNLQACGGDLDKAKKIFEKKLVECYKILFCFVKCYKILFCFEQYSLKQVSRYFHALY